ncbi:MAG: site-specific tyrosine recombinase XerC [Planctomycetes bacterium ADurb.Bin126]|nr:MAG: site-specific tyrosine recombinase XerC [Planctomycetes bacterium ADurb.Bin126]HOD81750.1 site-specific integrase [Phycisphaerae bacterium]HQL74708.1 site-specific integrase [Phycisphaerae bacterium]
MATLYRKIYPVPMPEGARIVVRRGKQVAQWTDKRGRSHEAPLAADGKKIMHEAGPWYARYRDADGNEKRASTGCTDEQAAGQVLADLLAEVEKVRSGILTPEEGRAARQINLPIAEHIADYLDYLKAKTIRGRKISVSHRYNVEKQLNRLVRECGLVKISDITKQRMTKWLNQQTDAAGKAPRTILKYRNTLTAFCKWAARDGRLVSNPLAELPGVAMDEDRRKRRPLTVEELGALLDAAATRPLREALLIRRGARKGQQVAKVRQSVRDELVRLGRERALIYKTLVYTGLRKGELASLTVADLYLDAEQPYAKLAAKNAKSGKSAHLPLRADLVEDLRRHLDEKLAQYRMQTLKDHRTEVPTALPPTMKAFDVPRDLVKIFNRDLVDAGLAREVTDPETGKTRIEKSDINGRTVDVHSLRHTFATLLSKAGVVPRMAQELMRHSDIRLTMNVYTHLQLVDTAGAVETLPTIGIQRQAAEQRATGTNGR